MGQNGNRNHGWRGGKVRSFISPRTLIAGGNPHPHGTPTVLCPVCGRPAWAYNGGASYAHELIHRGTYDCGLRDICTR